MENTDTLQNTLCPLCDSLFHKEIYSSNSIRIVRCESCRFMFQNPRKPESPDINLSKNYYHPNFLISENAHMKLFEEKYNEFLSHRRPGKILDIGCATGSFLRVMKNNGWQVSGIDVSEWACDYSKSQGLQNIFCTTIENALFDNESFDAVNMNHTLEHVHDPIKTLTEVYRVLKPGGLLLIEVPNERLFPYNYKLINALMPKHLPRRNTPHSHFCLFTTRTLKKNLEMSGFKIKLLREEGFSSTGRIGTYVFKKKNVLVKSALALCHYKLDVHFKLGRYIVAIAQK